MHQLITKSRFVIKKYMYQINYTIIVVQIMWLVGKGRLKLKVDQCRDDTPEAIIELIRQCTEFDRELRPDFAPEV